MIASFHNKTLEDVRWPLLRLRLPLEGNLYTERIYLREFFSGIADFASAREQNEWGVYALLTASSTAARMNSPRAVQP